MRDDDEKMARHAEMTNDIMETYSLTLFLGGYYYGQHNKGTYRRNDNRIF